MSIEKVITFEPVNHGRKHAFWLYDPLNVLCVNEGILNQLNSTQTENIAWYKYFNEQMQLVYQALVDEDGTEVSDAAIELARYFGVLGLEAEDDYEVVRSDFPIKNYRN